MQSIHKPTPVNRNGKVFGLQKLKQAGDLGVTMLFMDLFEVKPIVCNLQTEERMSFVSSFLF